MEQCASIARVSEQYDALRHVYDHVFSLPLAPGRRRVVDAANAAPGRSVLEVGVGTGLSLPHYRSDKLITGVDISDGMLQKAARRVGRHGLSHIRLLKMDAEALSFPDHSFATVVAMYVVSTTDSPARLMREMQRVCRPGGRLFILNHFSQERGVMRRVEEALLPVTSRIGWKSYFSRSQLQLPGLRLVSAARTNIFGYWQVLEFETAS